MASGRILCLQTETRGEKIPSIQLCSITQAWLNGEGLMRNVVFENARVENLPVHSHCTALHDYNEQDRIQTAARDCVTIPPSLASHRHCFFFTSYVQKDVGLLLRFHALEKTPQFFTGSIEVTGKRIKGNFKLPSESLRGRALSAPTFSLAVDL